MGEVLSEAALRKVKDEADIAWLKARGIQALSRRMISERDLRRKLTEEGRPKQLRDDVIAHLTRYGLLDDHKFAAALVRSQLAHGPRSRLYLKQKLREKGVSDEIAQEAIETEYAEFDEIGAVKEMAVKKYKTVKHLPPQQARGRVINFLRGRGFPWETIRKAIDGLVPNDRDSDAVL